MTKMFSNKHRVLLCISLTAVGAGILSMHLMTKTARMSEIIGCEKAVTAALASESDKSDSELVKLFADVSVTNMWVILPPEKYDVTIRLLVQQSYELDPPDRSLPKAVLLDPWGRRFEILVKRLSNQSGFAFRVRTSDQKPGLQLDGWTPQNLGDYLYSVQSFRARLDSHGRIIFNRATSL